MPIDDALPSDIIPMLDTLAAEANELDRRGRELQEQGRLMILRAEEIDRTLKEIRRRVLHLQTTLAGAANELHPNTLTRRDTR